MIVAGQGISVIFEMRFLERAAVYLLNNFILQYIRFSVQKSIDWNKILFSQEAYFRERDFAVFCFLVMVFKLYSVLRL